MALLAAVLLELLEDFFCSINLFGQFLEASVGVFELLLIHQLLLVGGLYADHHGLVHGLPPL